MTDANGGFDRRGVNISTFTQGNEAKPLIEGRDMMAAVHDDLASCGDHEGDYVYFTAWCVQEDIMLMPQVNDPQETTVKKGEDMWALVRLAGRWGGGALSVYGVHVLIGIRRTKIASIR